MRLATFNVENLDQGSKARVDISVRAAVLRPALERLDADIVCLQEVNAQHVPGEEERRLSLSIGSWKAPAMPTFTARRPAAVGAARWPTCTISSRCRASRSWSSREVHHHFVAPPLHTSIGAQPGGGEQTPVRFERPLLLTTIALSHAPPLFVVNVHLRAPLASPVAGQKSGPFAWRTVGGWAEGFYLSALKREAQALELRLLVEEVLARDPAALLAVAGDFNAEDYGATLRIAVAAEEDLGTSELAARSLTVLDRALPADRRWSVLHHGRPQMLDHILASRALYGHFRAIEVHNEGLGDEALGYGKALHSAASYHAPVVAVFEIDGAEAQRKA